MPAAVGRALTVLDILANADAPRTTSQIAADAGIARASVVRLLDSLVADGSVELDEAGGYRTTLALWRLGSASVNRLVVREIAFPYLVELTASVPAHVTLCLAEFPEGIVVESWRSVAGRLLSRFMGGRFHLLANAAGRAIAAHESDEIQEALLAIPLPQATEHTHVDPRWLREELACVRAQGYATIDREHDADVSGFALPLLNAEGRPAASMGFARMGPLDQDFVHQHVPMAKDVAQRISWELGWRGGGDSRVS